MEERQLARFRSVYFPSESGDVTPARIDRFRKNPDEMDADDLYIHMPPEIIEKFTSHKGNPRLDKIRRFKHDLKRLLHDYTPGQLLQISTECIKKNGCVIEEELQKILNDTEGI